MPKKKKNPIGAAKQETALNNAEKQLIKIQQKEPRIAGKGRKKK